MNSPPPRLTSLFDSLSPPYSSNGKSRMFSAGNDPIQRSISSPYCDPLCGNCEEIYKNLSIWWDSCTLDSSMISRFPPLPLPTNKYCKILAGDDTSRVQGAFLWGGEKSGGMRRYYVRRFLKGVGREEIVSRVCGWIFFLILRLGWYEIFTGVLRLK